jgi:hypothetical protein
MPIGRCRWSREWLIRLKVRVYDEAETVGGTWYWMITTDEDTTAAEIRDRITIAPGSPRPQRSPTVTLERAPLNYRRLVGCIPEGN